MRNSAMNSGRRYHRREHERYRPDDNARDRAISIARRADPAADHAAQATVIYPLQRRARPSSTHRVTLKNYLPRDDVLFHVRALRAPSFV